MLNLVSFKPASLKEFWKWTIRNSLRLGKTIIKKSISKSLNYCFANFANYKLNSVASKVKNHEKNAKQFFPKKNLIHLYSF